MTLKTLAMPSAFFRYGAAVLLGISVAVVAFATPTNADIPATQPAFDYKPGVDRVMNELRDDATRDSAERIMRGFPEVALPIARHNLTSQFNDLPPDVRSAVLIILDRNHAARAHYLDLNDADHRWNDDSATELYKKFGHHDPAWDDSAIKAILSVVDTKPDFKLIEKLNSQGCDNPMFVYFSLRAKTKEDKDHKLVKPLDDVADTIVSLGYPASRKCFALAYSVLGHLPASGNKLGDDENKNIKARLDSALSFYPDAVKENMGSLKESQLADLLQENYFRLWGDRLKAFETVYPVVSAALPGSTVPLDLKGTAYINLAWDARDSGWASTVTEKGAALMMERLQTARAALTEAWKKDSFDYIAATQMITVVLGDGSGKNEMEQWFVRAVEAYPDYVAAYHSKMYFLEPKWYGSPDEMIAFGHECAATQNYGLAIPLRLVGAHEALSHYTGQQYSLTPVRAYFHDNAPMVWDDISSVYVPTLALYPNDYFDRSYFARYAAWCHHYDEADRQFKLLGDHVNLRAFTSQTELDELRGEAASNAANHTP
jgi:hypothetical protein